MSTNQSITDKRRYYWRNRAQAVLITENIMSDMGISLTSPAHLNMLEMTRAILELTSDLKDEEEVTDETP